MFTKIRLCRAYFTYWAKSWRTSVAVAKLYRRMDNDQRNDLAAFIGRMADRK